MRKFAQSGHPAIPRERKKPESIKSIYRDVERGAVATSDATQKTHSVVAASIGGGAAAAGLGWDFGSSGDLGATSVQTFPSPSPYFQSSR
jgi:hypothetical protein